MPAANLRAVMGPNRRNPRLGRSRMRVSSEIDEPVGMLLIIARRQRNNLCSVAVLEIKVRLMTRWESLIDQKIREAMEQGEFDNLAGAGQPIDLSENPFEDPGWRTAHRLLRNAGFAPAWIEERKDIEFEIDAARNQLERVWTILQNE